MSPFILLLITGNEFLTHMHESAGSCSPCVASRTRKSELYHIECSRKHRARKELSGARSRFMTVSPYRQRKERARREAGVGLSDSYSCSSESDILVLHIFH